MAVIGKGVFIPPTSEDNRLFATSAAAEAYLASAAAKAGQSIKIYDSSTGKYKGYIIQNGDDGFVLSAGGSSAIVDTELPSVADGDPDMDYYIGSAADGYTHYRLIGSAYVPVGGDSYTKSEINQMLANGYMKLLDPSLTGMRVPADGDAPDMTDDAYKALPVGQIFICVINDEPTYWIKQDDSHCKDVHETGLSFDSGVVDDEGYLHLTLNGHDIAGFDPFFVGTGGGGGGGTAAGINLSNVVKPSSTRNGADAIFSFTASSTDDTNVSVSWYVDGIIKTSQNDRVSGSSFSFNAGSYIKPSDTSTVKAVITSESGASLSRQWNITSTAFSISWGSAITPVTLFTANENVYLVVNVSAQSATDNIVTVSIGNTDIAKTVTGSRAVTYEINKNLFSSGVNTVTATMVSALDAEDQADPISFKAIWGYGASNPIVAFADSTLDASQYDIAKIKYFVYDPNHETASCTMQIGSGETRSLNATRTMQTLDYVPQTYGTQTVTLTCGSASTTMTLNIAQSAYNIGMVTGDNLRYNLDPTGHSNSDADRENFGNMTFSTGFDWVNGGFKTGTDGAPAFIVKKGHSVTLPRQIFGDTDGNGKTIDISFSVRNSDQYDAVAMQELNNGESKGIILRSNEGELRLNNTTGQLFRYCEDSRIDMAINVEEVNDQRVMTVWLDGVPAQVTPYTANTLVQTENSLVIGSEHCDVWIYAIHIYNTSLSLKEMIQNYISLAPTTAQKITRSQENDIYAANGAITPSSLHDAKPDLTIVHISAERMTTNKEDPVNATVTIRDGSTVLTLDNNTKFKVQGTSSAAYGRSAYNLDIDFKKSGYTYAISENAIPVNYLNIKVNVASSENANNICAADWYNTYQPYLVPARANDGVRDTVEGKPCAVFFTNTSSNTIWVGSQQVIPGQTILYAMGDLCNSKKNKEVFGQDGTGEHYALGCIEVSGNDTPAQQFKATSTYNASADDGKGQWETTSSGKVSKDYEWRAEPKSADKAGVVAAWDATVAWTVSTNTAAATGNTLAEDVEYDGVTYQTDSAAYRLAKFKAEVGDYFALDSLLYHFLYLEYFEAFDNVSKNTFYSYEWDEDAGKYLWNICKNYDDDTILGCDNDGKPLADYGADFGDKVGNRSLFNADTNTIWVNIRDGFGDSLASMYKSLRSDGAWSAANIISKWDTYQSKRPRAAMAEDAYRKYILPYKTTGVIVGNDDTPKGYDDTYLDRLQGPKTYQRRQYLTYQSKYMDGKYGYYSISDSINFRANADVGTTRDLVIKVYAKTIVTVIVDNGTVTSHKIATGGTATFSNTATHSNTTIYVVPESLVESITPIDNVENTTFNAAGATKLQDVILGSSESENTSWVDTPLNIPSAVLKNLSIRNIVHFTSDLNLSANVELETLDTRGTATGIITLPSYAPLTDINLNACSGITALNLNKVTTFSMTNGNNLTSIRVENCNSVINNAMATLITHSVNYGGNATRNIRITGVDWTLENADMLYAIATRTNIWHGYNAMGEAIDTPIITGSCYVGKWSAAEKATVERAFPDIDFEYGEIVPSYTVTFKNYDGTVLNTQTVKEQSAAVNPVTAGLIPAPTKEPSVEYTYSFIGWDTPFNHILQDTIVTAQFSEQDRYYTVRYFDGTVLLQTDSVIAHGSSSYTGEPLSGAGGIWVGWDSYADDVVSDMDIYAQYLNPTLPDNPATNYDYLYSDDPEDNSGYTLAEFYGIILAGSAKTYFNIGDKIKIVPHTNVFVDSEIVLQLYGFNHFKITDSDTFATCVFGMVGVMNAMRGMNPSNTNVGGWGSTTMRTYLNGTVFDALPLQWQSMIKSVDVKSSIGNTSATIDTTSDKLFLFSYAEVGFGANEVPYKNEVDSGAEQVTFSLFTSNASRIKKTYNGEGGAQAWWLRSPYASASAAFCGVGNAGGTASNNGASYAYGVSFGFCI